MKPRANFALPGWQPVTVLTTLLAVLTAAVSVEGQTLGQPFAVLEPTTPLAFPNGTDSNSPAAWEMVEGQWTLAVLNSVDGLTSLSTGRNLSRLAPAGQVSFHTAAPIDGYWFEAVIRDNEAWYGYYHNELSDFVCPGTGKVLARIGAARSDDHGRTWADLGPIIETPPGEESCDTRNHYFVGGAGDFTALLDAGGAYVYFYYTQYAEKSDGVGVSAARLAWADRDAPRGRIDIWHDGAWLPAAPASAVEPPAEGIVFPLATPILKATDRWDNATAGVDVFWGPSIHWNTSLRSYVMLLNRAASAEWEPGGVYLSYNPRLDDPNGWTPPVRLLGGGRWYPQVVGLAVGKGTDAFSGATARFFMGGRSEHNIVFARR